MTLTNAQLDRAVGVLLGTAAGDALGAAYEFGPPRGPELEVAMVGGGSFGWALDAIVRRWDEWMQHAKDVGIQTSNVLRAAQWLGLNARTSGEARLCNHSDQRKVLDRVESNNYFPQRKAQPFGALLRPSQRRRTMDTDAPTPEEAAQALGQINRQHADAVHRAFWSPWWLKLGSVAALTGIGLSRDLTLGALREAVLWGSVLAVFALIWLRRRLAAVRPPSFSPRLPSLRVWLFIAGVVVLIVGLPILLGRLGVPFPYMFGFFATGVLAMLANTWIAPREQAERVAALADPQMLDAEARETFASRHSTGRLWAIYLGVTVAVTLALTVPIVAVATALDAPGYLIAYVIPPLFILITIATAIATMRWFHRPLKHQQDADNS
jgi:hypothetical protein